MMATVAKQRTLAGAHPKRCSLLEPLEAAGRRRTKRAAGEQGRKRDVSENDFRVTLAGSHCRRFG